MDLEALDVETFSSKARQSGRRFLTRMAACRKRWISAALDINMAFLKGFTYQELAEATGEMERVLCLSLPPGSASVLGSLPGFERYDESRRCLQCSNQAQAPTLHREPSH
eukprot:7497941-Pyramimonas_sp.AAC.1